MYKSLYQFKDIVIAPDVVKRDWTELQRELQGVRNKTLLHQSGGISQDPTLEYFLNSAFDDTGSIRIRKKDFNLFQSPLKDYFLMKWNSANLRMIEDSTHYYLRGNMYYLTYMNIDIELLIIKILEEVEEIEMILPSMQKPMETETNYIDFMLLLGLLDNRKNHVLEILSAIHQIQRLTNDLYLTEYEYKNLINYIQTVTDDFYSALLTKRFDSKSLRRITSIQAIMDKILVCIIRNKKVLISKKEIIRKFREASHPYHNALLANRVISDWIQFRHYDSLMGIEYGGIELPFVVNAFAKMRGLAYFPIHFIKCSHYSQKLHEKNDSYLSPYGYNSFPSLLGLSILVLDDNTLTGRTVEYIAHYLKRFEVKDIYLGFIGYSGEKRYHQMVMPNHGCINPAILMESSVIVTESPFTRIYNSKSYKNKNGVFNKVQNKIERTLNSNYPSLIYEK